MSLTQKSCLVLNRSWAPVGTVSLQRAICMLFSAYADGEPKAKIIEHSSYQTYTWEDWSKLRPKATDDVIKSGNLWFRVPEIILLTRYDKVPQPKVHFSRRNLFKRDRMTCQYCGSKPGSHELTIDHVLPRSKGGDTSWTNCVLACIDCNTKKGNKTPEQAGMKLRKKPKQPRASSVRFDMLKPVKSWQAFLGEAYWSVELRD